MSVCLLSSEELGRLHNYGLLPCHQAHRHIPISRALKLIEAGTHDLIEHEGQHYLHKPPLHVLKVVGISIQRVRGVPAKHITPAEMTELLTFEQEQMLYSKEPSKKKAKTNGPVAPVRVLYTRKETPWQTNKR